MCVVFLLVIIGLFLFSFLKGANVLTMMDDKERDTDSNYLRY